MTKAKFRTWLLYRKPGTFLKTVRERWRFGLVVAGLISVSWWLGQSVVVEPPAKWYHDFQLRRRKEAQEVMTRTVYINSEHYGNRATLVVQAACAIAALGPAVVVVDLDTSESDPRNHGFPPDFRLPQTSVPIVWAADTTSTKEGKEEVVKVAPILGGRVTIWPPYGIATMPTDFDGVVRTWRAFVPINTSATPTLPWAAIQQYCRHDGSKCSQSRLKAFQNQLQAFTTRIDFMDVPLSGLLTEAPSVSPETFPASCPDLPPDDRLQGRIVVLGENYSRADEHETPWGPLRGAQLVAMAIEQAFSPAPQHDVDELFLIVLEVGIAFLIAAIHHWIRPIPATVITIILLPAGVIISSELMFLFGDYEVGIVPFMVGMLIHQLVGSAERAEHREKVRHRSS
jgi:CHASE2 domain-containing sensor protein